MMTTTTTTAVIQCNQSTLRHGQETDRYCCFLDDKWDSLSTADWVAQSTNQQEQEQRVRGSRVGWLVGTRAYQYKASRSLAPLLPLTPRPPSANRRHSHDKDTRQAREREGEGGDR